MRWHLETGIPQTKQPVKRLTFIRTCYIQHHVCLAIHFLKLIKSVYDIFQVEVFKEQRVPARNN